MGRRYVVLQFDDGDRFDYEPPLPHPADVFLDRFPSETQLNSDIGAASVFEVDPIVAKYWEREDNVTVLYAPGPDVKRREMEAARRWMGRTD